MLDSKLASTLLFGTAALAGLGFAVISRRVARGKTSQSDRSAQQKLHAQVGPGLDAAAAVSGPIGKWYVHLPTALATARRLHKAGRPRGAMTVVASSIGAAILSRSLDRLMKQRRPPPERGEPWEQSFPSGHALETTALALTSAYVLRREGLAPAWSIGPITVQSFASGAGRLIRDRHWASDVIGGYCAGVALGAVCAGVYEVTSTPGEEVLAFLG
jgi:membrane-associated phospholipid phosphatase